jgi:hypothetical protein
VTGVAVDDLPESQKGGKRDKGHGGWTVDKFCTAIDSFVAASAQKKWPTAAALKAAFGTVKWDAPMLTREEVLAIRLYTGPCYQPINNFLREVSKLGPDWRHQLAVSHQHTYTATVRHLCNGLRKLVRVGTDVSTPNVMPVEIMHVLTTTVFFFQFGDVYRCVRGELPESFWLCDKFGVITATDFGFSSTSLDRIVSESFLGTAAGVLWKIECSDESEEGFHSAADVSLLSQFPEEKEMLFPPLTMLQVKMSSHPSGGTSTSAARKSITSASACETGTTVNGAKYKCIFAKPTFI